MKRFIEDHTREHFDVIVIGGGITGASVAYEAATRGLKVLLLEKNDFSWATSSATSKLIHGGLRYLANGEIRLVRESLRERRVLENIAPNFVYPMPMMMTHYDKPLKNNKWIVKAGMLLYDLLSYDKGFTWDPDKKIPWHQTISKNAVLKREPNVRPKGLTGASIFYDCASIFPERLTLAFIKSAAAYGACVSNYARVEGFLIDANHHVTGVRVMDLLKNRPHDITGSVTVNCAGPWADILLGHSASDYNGCSVLRRSEGIHIITQKKLISGKYLVGAMTPEGRHFFLIPWRKHTLIGTTDKPFVGNPDDYHVTKISILELLDDVNRSFGDGTLSFADVLHTYGGLRPLVEDQTKDTYASSRRYEMHDNLENGLNGLITVEGGKYTTSRNLAEKCLEMVCAKLGKAAGRSITTKNYLKGSEIRDLNFFISDAMARHKDFSPATMDYLSRHYGTQYPDVIALAHTDKALAETLNKDGEILAQVVYAVRQEMARTLSDVVLRRTGIATLGNPGEAVLRKVSAIVANELHWSRNQTEEEISSTIDLLRIPEA
ncbi:MAG: glycerol-3-phosphate dehydrogenase/oxidase [Smithellaceae bacterium]